MRNISVILRQMVSVDSVLETWAFSKILNAWLNQIKSWSLSNVSALTQRLGRTVWKFLPWMSYEVVFFLGWRKKVEKESWEMSWQRWGIMIFYSFLCIALGFFFFGLWRNKGGKALSIRKGKKNWFFQLINGFYYGGGLLLRKELVGIRTRPMKFEETPLQILFNL